MAHVAYHFRDKYTFHESGSYVIPLYPGCPWIVLCSPDGIVKDLDGNIIATLEIKCPGIYDMDEEQNFSLRINKLKQEIHYYYRLQVDAQMRALGVGLAFHACMNPLNGFTWMEYAKSDALWDAMENSFKWAYNYYKVIVKTHVTTRYLKWVKL